MNAGRKHLIIGIAIIAAGFAAVCFLSSFIENDRVSLPPDYEDQDLSLQGKKMKGFVFGAEGLVADWYWMQSLQYIGNKIERSDGDDIDLGDLRSLNPRLLYPLLDNATDLDPKFMAAYSYGATVLPAVDGNLAIKLTEKGIANNPDQWRLYQYLGYIYWQSKKYDAAARVYQTGSELAGAPTFFKQMMAVMKTQGGDRSTARSIYGQMLTESPDQSTRDTARLRLLQLDSLDERDALNNALAKAKDATGTCPLKFSEVFDSLRSVDLPSGKDLRIDQSGNVIDPSGAPYLLDPETCTAKLDASKTKIPVR